MTAALTAQRGLVLAGMVCGLSLGTGGKPTLAQDVDEGIMRRQQEYLERLEQERLKPFLAPPPAEDDVAPTPTEDTLGDAPCFDIHTITLEGPKATTSVPTRDLTDPLLGQCLGMAEIDRLVRDLTAAYVEAGYVTTRVYIPQQSLKSGTLKLVVIEGTLDGFETGLSGLERSNLAMAFPGLTGEVLNLRDLEQGLDQINRLSRYNLKMMLEPGQKQGGTTVALSGHRQKAWQVHSSVDNSGSQATGATVAGLQGTLEDMLGLNEQWTVNWKGGPVPVTGPGRNESLSGALSLPVGWWLLSLSANRFTYSNPISGLNRIIDSRGVSRTRKLRLDRVVHRDNASKTVAAGAVTVKDSVNYVQGLRIAASSRRLAVGSLDVTHSRRVLGGALSVTVGTDVGLRAFGAEKDGDQPSHAARAQFRKYRLNMNYWRPLPSPVEGIDVEWTSALSGQWSRHTLFSTERISAGGPYSVRGFKDQSISGDVGGWWRNDLRLTLPPTGITSLDQVMGRPYISTGFDGGWIRPDHRDAFERGTVTGLSATLGMRGGAVNGSFTVGRALRVPQFLRPKKTVFYFTLSTAF